MAKRQTRSARSPGLAPGRRHATQIHTDIRELESRIADLDAFDPATITLRSDPRIQALEISIRDALTKAFGDRTSRYRSFEPATRLDRYDVTLDRATPLEGVIMGLREGKARSLEFLRRAVQALREDLADLQAEATAPGLEPRSSNATVGPFVSQSWDVAAQIATSRPASNTAFMSTGGVTEPILPPEPVNDAAPPHAGAAEPDPAGEREIFAHATAPQASTAPREIQWVNNAGQPVTWQNDKGEPITWVADAEPPIVAEGPQEPLPLVSGRARIPGRRGDAAPTILGAIDTAATATTTARAKRKPAAKAVAAPASIRIKNKAEVIRYSKILIVALDEVLNYVPGRHHNEPPPALRIDNDSAYLQEIRNLVAELQALNTLLAQRQNKRAASAVGGLARHFDTFLNAYAKSMAYGTAALTIGVISHFLEQAGVAPDIIGSILSHLKLR